MKILFLEIDTENAWALASSGPAFIASAIRELGHDASLLRVRPDDAIQDVIQGIERAAPHLLGFSLTTRQWLRAREAAGKIREKLSIPIIAGGLHATFAPDILLESGVFDCVCLGEGEEAVGEMLSALEKGADLRTACLPNIWAKGAARPEIRPPLPVGRLPLMARDLLDEAAGVVHMSTMRGCPFPCTFCAGGAVQRFYGSRAYLRRRPVANVLDELRQLRENGPVNYVIFLDDTFTLHQGWLKEFCGAYGREMGTGFSINGRAETVTPDMIRMLAHSGCKHIIYGVESGSPRIRRDILKRPGTNGQHINAFRWTQEAGMLATANYMIGIPGETPDDIEQTISLNEELAPDDFGFFVFYPYPGTPLAELCRERGYLPEHYMELPCDTGETILNLPDLSREDIKEYYRRLADIREQNFRKRYGRG